MARQPSPTRLTGRLTSSAPPDKEAVAPAGPPCAQRRIGADDPPCGAAEGAA